MKDSLVIQPLKSAGPKHSTKTSEIFSDKPSPEKTGQITPRAEGDEFSDTFKTHVNEISSEKDSNPNDTIKDFVSGDVIEGQTDIKDNKGVADLDMLSLIQGTETPPDKYEMGTDLSHMRAEEIAFATIKAETPPTTGPATANITPVNVDNTEVPIPETTVLTEIEVGRVAEEQQFQTIKYGVQTLTETTDKSGLSATQISNLSLLNVEARADGRSLRQISSENQSVRFEGDEIDLEAIEVDVESAANDLIDIDVEIPKQNVVTQNFGNQNSAPHTSSLQHLNIATGLEVAAPSLSASTNIAVPTGNITVQITPALSNTVVNTVAQAVISAKETPKGLMVQLDPPELGRVYIDFLFEADNKVTVVVKSDSAESHNILRERSQEFMEMLGESGFSNIDLSFERQDSNSGNGSENEQSAANDINIAYADATTELLEESYKEPLYQINKDQLRLDLRL